MACAAHLIATLLQDDLRGTLSHLPDSSQMACAAHHIATLLQDDLHGATTTWQAAAAHAGSMCRALCV